MVNHVILILLPSNLLVPDLQKWSNSGTISITSHGKSMPSMEIWPPVRGRDCLMITGTTSHHPVFKDDRGAQVKHFMQRPRHSMTQNKGQPLKNYGAGPSAPQGEFHQSPPSHQWTGWCVSSGTLGEIQCIWKQQDDDDDVSLIDKRCHDRTHVARHLSCMSVRLVQNSSKVSRIRNYIMQVC